MALDPQMVIAGHWVWHVEGAYFGIPVQNFVGWLATTLTVYLAYRALEARWPPRPWGPASPAFERLPLVVYALLSFVAPGTYSPAVGILSSLCEPVLRPVRNVLPPHVRAVFVTQAEALGFRQVRFAAVGRGVPHKTRRSSKRPRRRSNARKRRTRS